MFSGWGLDKATAKETSEVLKTANVTFDYTQRACETPRIELTSGMLCAKGELQNVCKVSYKSFTKR